MAGQPGMAGRVPAGPVEAPPAGFVPEAGQAEILAAMLAGIELGAWDRWILGWFGRVEPPLTAVVAVVDGVQDVGGSAAVVEPGLGEPGDVLRGEPGRGGGASADGVGGGQPLGAGLRAAPQDVVSKSDLQLGMEALLRRPPA